jgi:DHA2 family multidrug resistance protein
VQPWLAVAAVLLGAMMTGFDTRVFSFGLTDLRGAFGLGFDEGAWLSTIATAPQLLIAPAIGWMVVVFGLRRVLIAPALLYALLSAALPLFHDYQILLVLHFVRALLLGMFIPAVIIVIVSSIPPRWWLPMLAIYVVRLPLSLNAGAGLAGWYVDGPGWQWIYWQAVPAALLLALLFHLGAPRVPVKHQMIDRADWGGMLLLGASVAMLYAGLDQGNRLDWLESEIVAGLLFGAAILFAAFLLNEALIPEPWAHIRVLLTWNVFLGIMTVVAYTITSLSNSQLLPNYLRTIAQLRPEQIAPLLFWYVAVPLIPLLVLAVWLLRRIDARYLIVAGLTGFAFAAWLGSRITGVWGPEDFIPMALVQAAAQNFTFLGIIVFTLSNAPPAQALALGAYIQVIRLDGSELGASLMTTFLREREQLHSHLIGLHVVSGDGDVATVLQRLSAFFAHRGSADLATARSVGSLGLKVQQQANVLSYIDGFQLTFWVAIAGLVLVALMRPSPPGPLSPKFSW